MKKKMVRALIVAGLIFSFSGTSTFAYTDVPVKPMTCPGGYVGPCLPSIIDPNM
ncbi:hypothetical protein [Ornithinibacillus scapharcae]|uniref:hypothetical protein n=1 Tax=Ornithinibacillus scapharcae TaxID=1147159 RepID=UPI000225B5D9|nr:hypothetical protein [Ornithinibacillus scapharcae]